MCECRPQKGVERFKVNDGETKQTNLSSFPSDESKSTKRPQPSLLCKSAESKSRLGLSPWFREPSMIINPQDPLGIIGFVYFGPAIYTGWRIMFHGIFSIGLFKWYNPLRWIIPIGAIVSAILLPYFLFDSVRRHFFDRARVVVVGPIPTKISLLLWSLVSVAISAILAIWLLSRVHFTNLQDIDSMRFKVMLRVFLEGLHIVPAAIFFLYVASEVRSVYVHKLWRVCDPKVLSVRNVGLTTKPPTNDRSSKLVKIAHLSDLHITSTYRSMCIDRSGPGGNKALAKLIRELQLTCSVLMLF